MWLDVDLETKGRDVRINSRGSRGERLPAHYLDPRQGFDALQSFSDEVGRAVRGGKSLDPAVVEAAQALYEELLKSELREVIGRMIEAANGDPLLIRLFIQDRALQTVPWEALCKPGTTDGFLGTSRKMLVARGVSSSDPWEPREVVVRGAVRVLVIAPGSDERALVVLREALAPSIDAGEIEWLDPIAGADISAEVLFDQLHRGKTAHVVHWLGHGNVDMSGKPVLRVADDANGEEVWITAEALASELSASFCEELRLVILEACEGGHAGVLGSAAEVLVKAGADAVVAHLWPVKADAARTCSTEVYRTLTESQHEWGDVGAAVAAARRTLVAQSAEAFSPILYLRGFDSVIFSFEGRRVNKQSDKRKSRNLAPELQALLAKPFNIVLGNPDEDFATPQDDLSQFMAENDDKAAGSMTLSALMQRCMLRFGQDVLHSFFQLALNSNPQLPPSPLINALGRLIPPGIHITMLWRPYLERASAEKQPERTIYAIQPALGAPGAKPCIVKRAARATLWKMEPLMPKRFDFDNEIVILRLYGGYSTEPHSMFVQPLLTEDGYIHGLPGSPSSWLEELLARLRIQPGLFVGLSLLDWRHRMLLQWLYDQRPAPVNSLAILTPQMDRDESEFWASGGGLPGTRRIASIIEDPLQLAPQLDAFEPKPT